MAVEDVSSSENNGKFGGEGYYDGFSPNDAEKQGGTTGPRKMSRIDRPVTKSITGDIPDDDATETSISVGKQMELEAGNSIKYRTCSWPKV